MTETKSERTTIALKLQYACGQLTDSIPFNMFYIYFLYFVTDVVGLPAVYGGIIALIVVLWDALTDPIVGYLSDNCKSKYGRRRPFMLAGVFPLFLCTVLLYTAVDFSRPITLLYYIAVGILYWTSYKTYVIPFFALGAELTQDFNDRTTLRGFAGVGIYVATWLVSAGPMMVLDKVTQSGGTEAQSWTISAVAFGLFGLAGGLICWRATKGKEFVDKSQYKAEQKAKLLANYKELFQLKAFRRFLLMTLAYNIAFSIASAAFVYIMDNNLGLSPAKQAGYWTIYSILTIAFIPICNLISNRFGKKQALISLNLISIAGCMFYFFYGIPDFTHLILFTAFYNIGNVCYWSVGYSMMYDCAELDEYVTGKRREGAITGFSSFMQKFGSAIGMYVTGGLLSLLGYDGTAEVQTQQALQGIITVNTLIPGILFMVGTVFIILYPVTKERFQNLLEAIEYKKEGKEYPQEKLNKIF